MNASNRPPCTSRVSWRLGLMAGMATALLPAAAQAAMPDWAGDVAGIGIRWRTIGLTVLVLLMTGLADAVLRWLVRRRIRRDEARAAAAPEPERRARYWLDRGLAEAVLPLAALVWVHGVYLALALPLVEIRFRDEAAIALRALDWLRGIATLAILFWLLYRVSRVAETYLLTLSARSRTAWDDVLVPLAGRAVRLTLPLLAVIFGAPALAASPTTERLVQNGVSLMVIGAVALLLFQLVQAAETLVLRQQRLDVTDNLAARKIVTQVTVLKKVAMVIIGIFTLASMLMVFESVRQFGTSILASAGIAGIIIGFAAQRSIATLLAGFQIAFTQPIRIDDVVIVENEWGRIEDITLTFVTVRIWDLRRLIVPITYFIERPFQNWTRASADLLGTVFFYVDYTAPLGPLRAEFDRILEASTYWDRKVKVLQVTDATERTMQLRALASAPDASMAWDLRCEIREKMIHFLQTQYPQSLPRVRAEMLALPAPP